MITKEEWGMTRIETQVDRDRELTVQTAWGELLAADVREKVMQFYQGQPTLYVLWDFRRAELSRIRTSEIRGLAALTQGFAGRREGGRTALVFASDLGFGLGRMFDIAQDNGRSRLPHMTFRNFNDAMDWLGV